MRKIWDGTVTQTNPMDAVTLVDNHDTQVGQSLEMWVNPQFKPLAYALILLRVDGYPCVVSTNSRVSSSRSPPPRPSPISPIPFPLLRFLPLLAKHILIPLLSLAMSQFYGDLYGCGGENPQEPMAQLEDFIRARKWYAYGELRDYSDHQNCLGWIRMGDDEHDGCAVVLSNGGDGSKRMEFGKVSRASSCPPLPSRTSSASLRPLSCRVGLRNLSRSSKSSN